MSYLILFPAGLSFALAAYLSYADLRGAWVRWAGVLLIHADGK